MKECELDRLMQRVLLDSIRLDWEQKPEPVPSFAPSAGYKRQVRAMLKDPLAWERKKAIPAWKKVVRRIAVVLLILSIGFSSLLAASPMVRAVFLQWITEWYETHVTYRYMGTDTVGVMPQYEITELPEGYAEVESERIDWPGQAQVVYRNESNGKTIYLNYTQMVQGFANDFKLAEDSEIIPIMVNGMDGQFFGRPDWENEWSTVTWIDSDSGLQFSVDAPLKKIDILCMAESVASAESTK